MRQQEQAIVAKGCNAMDSKFAAQEAAEGSDMGVGGVTVIAARKVVRMTDNSWDAVVKSDGKGTFLIRRQKGHLSTQCPLLSYEVRRVDAGRGCDRDERETP